MRAEISPEISLKSAPPPGAQAEVLIGSVLIKQRRIEGSAEAKGGVRLADPSFTGGHRSGMRIHYLREWIQTPLTRMCTHSFRQELITSGN